MRRTDEAVQGRVNTLKAEAEATPDYTHKCSYCKEYVVFVVHGHAVCEGHIYSVPGMKEYRITRLCEFCFDSITADAEDAEDSENEQRNGCPG